MKVKISKTININQIPNETRSMLGQIKNNLLYGLPDRMNQITMHSLSSSAEEFFLTIEAIDKFRQELAAFDELLQEVQNILVGYKEAIIPKEEQHDEEWLASEEAEYEKFMSQVGDVEGVSNEEG